MTSLPSYITERPFITSRKWQLTVLNEHWAHTERSSETVKIQGLSGIKGGAWGGASGRGLCRIPRDSRKRTIVSLSAPRRSSVISEIREMKCLVAMYIERRFVHRAELFNELLAFVPCKGGFCLGNCGFAMIYGTAGRRVFSVLAHVGLDFSLHISCTYVLSYAHVNEPLILKMQFLFLWTHNISGKSNKDKMT